MSEAEQLARAIIGKGFYNRIMIAEEMGWDINKSCQVMQRLKRIKQYDLEKAKIDGSVHIKVKAIADERVVGESEKALNKFLYGRV